MKRPTKNFSCVKRGTKMSDGRKKYPCRITSSKRMRAPTITIPKGENSRTLPNRYKFFSIGIFYQKVSLITNTRPRTRILVPQNLPTLPCILQKRCRRDQLSQGTGLSCTKLQTLPRVLY